MGYFQMKLMWYRQHIIPNKDADPQPRQMMDIQRQESTVMGSSQRTINAWRNPTLQKGREEGEGKGKWTNLTNVSVYGCDTK